MGRTAPHDVVIPGGGPGGAVASIGLGVTVVPTGGLAIAAPALAMDAVPHAPPTGTPALPSATNAALQPSGDATDDALVAGYETGGLRSELQCGVMRDVEERPPTLDGRARELASAPHPVPAW